MGFGLYVATLFSCIRLREESCLFCELFEERTSGLAVNISSVSEGKNCLNAVS